MPKKHTINHTHLDRKARVLATGAMPEIQRLFIWPLLRLRPDAQRYEAGFEELLQIQYRDISRYRANRDFKLRGNFLIKKDSMFLVRWDKRENHIDVQPLDREEDVVWRMRKFHLSRIARYATKQEDVCKYKYTKGPIQS